jgi:hypothetical protein
VLGCVQVVLRVVLLAFPFLENFRLGTTLNETEVTSSNLPLLLCIHVKKKKKKKPFTKIFKISLPSSQPKILSPTATPTAYSQRRPETSRPPLSSSPLLTVVPNLSLSAFFIFLRPPLTSHATAYPISLWSLSLSLSLSLN